MRYLDLKVCMFCLLYLLLFAACKQQPDTSLPTEDAESTEVGGDVQTENREGTNTAEKELIPEGWSELTEDEGFIVDIKYATLDNFTKKQIYDCGRCWLRPEAAEKVRKIRRELKEKFGYGVRLFDCFRPRPYQQRLWDAVPDPDYVTPPQKGSMHSRGLAVDLTITDAKGKDLDMGTAYDYFGKEAHQDFTGHSQDVNKNRTLLKDIMKKHGFALIRTEWWHYSDSTKSYPLDSWVWPCN
jgi:D-alanyl-D-alanine dipeptidase